MSLSFIIFLMYMSFFSGGNAAISVAVISADNSGSSVHAGASFKQDAFLNQ